MRTTTVGDTLAVKRWAKTQRRNSRHCRALDEFPPR